MASATVLALVAAIAWVVERPQPAPEVDASEGVVGTTLSEPGVGVATSGSNETAPAADAGPAVKTLDTLTDATDADAAGSLVGRPVDLTGRVADRGNRRTFWLSDSGRRVLVVLRSRPTTRTDEHVVLDSHRVLPARQGHTVRVTGTLEAVPSRAARATWDLTPAVDDEVARQGVYVNAADAWPVGHDR